MKVFWMCCDLNREVLCRFLFFLSIKPVLPHLFERLKPVKPVCVAGRLLRASRGCCLSWGLPQNCKCVEMMPPSLVGRLFVACSGSNLWLVDGPRLKTGPSWDLQKVSSCGYGGRGRKSIEQKQQQQKQQQHHQHHQRPCCPMLHSDLRLIRVLSRSV